MRSFGHKGLTLTLSSFNAMEGIKSKADNFPGRAKNGNFNYDNSSNFEEIISLNIQYRIMTSLSEIRLTSQCPSL